MPAVPAPDAILMKERARAASMPVKPKGGSTLRAATPRTATPTKANGPAKAGAKAKSAGAVKRIGATADEMGDWRVETMARVRALIKQADPGVVEEVKWRKASNNMAGVPVWSHGGMICTGETYKDKVKFTFAKGAALPDPGRLFNAPDTGATRRAIDLFKGRTIDEKAFKALVKAAVALNKP